MGCIAVVGTVGCVTLIANPVLSTVIDALCMLRQFRKARDYMRVFDDFPAYACICIPILVIIRIVRIDELQVAWYLAPCHPFPKRLFVSIKALKALFPSVQRRVLLMSKSDARARDAFSIGLGALGANGSFFTTFQLLQQRSAAQ